MSESTSSSMTITADPAVVLDVIADFDDYHQWAENVTRAQVLTQDSDGWARTVRFELDAGVLRDTYVLAYDWDILEDGTGTVSWELVESTVIRALDGSYQLQPAGDRTQVTYQLCVDVNIPVVAVLRRKAEKSIIDQALRGLKQRCES
ncbi:SRPBCC family protein [Allobranchiibius sp. CTAmp26]|uniref:SRPBCC family protein n=1 Tax=Allobranchiibius sp. CTAmp26 TaxID=2815214 RepID=UPI001AA0DFF3|nr:SRPBCC family protein [Allobranchiibius sp. CTAmp26]MBO1755327.1 SRPBCC family protein [Allobranchiibius sp. CTAmp26]